MIRSTLFFLVLGTTLAAQDVAVPDITQIRNEPSANLDWVPPLPMQQALALAEDRTWFDSFPANSPISRQVARLYITDGTQTSSRSLIEAQLAVDLANAFTPDEIMSLYAQRIDFGARCIGYHAALEHRFDTAMDEAGLNEFLTLAAVIRAPYLLDREPERLARRFEFLATEGAHIGFWSQSVADTLIASGPTVFIPNANCPDRP